MRHIKNKHEKITLNCLICHREFSCNYNLKRHVSLIHSKKSQHLPQKEGHIEVVSVEGHMEEVGGEEGYMEEVAGKNEHQHEKFQTFEGLHFYNIF